MQTKFNFKTFTLLLILVVNSCSSSDSEENPPQEEAPLSAETLTNVSYGEDSEQVYDIYLPENRAATYTKVLVLIHGGSWTQGDKADMETYVSLLKSKLPDYAIANVNYKLAAPPSTTAFPDQFLDIKTIIDDISSKSTEYSIMPEFGLIGTSAGAHLALQVDYVYDDNDMVKMIASIVGPTDFTDPFYTQNPNYALALPLLIDTSAYPENSNFAKDASPAFQVTAKSSPTIMFYGSNDELVPVSNGQLLQSKLEAAGVVNDLTIYEGGHGTWSESSNIDLQTKMVDFIKTYLKIQK
ncbi:MAG: alpha/beta hydrolase [Leeuwenhoekiella sp.]